MQVIYVQYRFQVTEIKAKNTCSHLPCILIAMEILHHQALYTLGKDSRDIPLQYREEHRLICEQMAAQAQRSLRIISRHMDKAIYDTPVFIEHVSRLARKSKYSQIQLLVHDTLPAVHSGHRLIDLSQRLSSYVLIRKISSEYADFNAAFLIADDHGIVYRKLSDRYEGNANFNAPLHAREMTKLFMEIWELSLPDPQIRKLHL